MILGLELPALATFGLVLAAWSFGVVLVMRRRDAQHRRLRERLGEDDGSPLSTESLAAARASVRAFLDRLETRAGWRLPAWSMLLIVGGAALVAGLVCAAWTGRALPGVVAVAVVVTAAWWDTSRRSLARAEQLERQLVDALELISHGLGAGRALPEVFGVVARETPAPIGPVFARVLREHASGLRQADALRGAAERTGSAGLRLLANALAIRVHGGGDPANVTAELAGVLRERQRVDRGARSAAARLELSARLLVALPVLCLAALHALRPDYASALFAPGAGLSLLALAGLALLLAWFSLHRGFTGRV